MKILLITPGILPVPATSGGAVENLIDYYLQKQNKNEITVFSCKSGNFNINNYKNVKFNFINDKLFSYRLLRKFNDKILKSNENYYLKKVKKLVKKNNENYDIVIVENQLDFIIPMEKIFKDKIILHLHNDYLYKEIKNSEKIGSKCRNVFCVSNYVKSRVDTVPTIKKSCVLYNGIDLEKFNNNIEQNKKEYVRKKYSIKKSNIVFLYTGRLQQKKGIKELIVAFIKLLDDFPNIKLLIVGSYFYSKYQSNPFLNELKQLSREYKKQIIFTGYVDYNEIPTIYKICDVQVIPSICEDACPLTVIEGMAAGLPLIVSKSGGIPELVNKNCAICIGKNEKFIENLYLNMKKFILDKNKREKMKIASLENSKKFSIDNYVKNFNRLLVEEIKDKNGFKE